MMHSTVIRVENESSVGRTYSKSAEFQPGLGKLRQSLQSKSFRPYGMESCTTENPEMTSGDAHEVSNPTFLPSVTQSSNPIVSSYTLLKTHRKFTTKQDLLEYFWNTWAITDTLFDSLRDDSVFYMFPDKLRRPLIFYFGHAAALYANKLHAANLCENVDLRLQRIFETGVDEMSWDDMDDMQREDFPWPTVQETQEFRLKTKRIVEKIIQEMNEPLEQQLTQDKPYWALLMGFEHERIHIETSSVLIRQLPISAVRRPKSWRYGPINAQTPEEAPQNSVVTIQSGNAQLGKPTQFPTFGWDNEYGSRSVQVPEFQVSKFLVTNAEFLPFVLSGGYQQRTWWISPTGDDEGWRWRTYRNATHPSFWVATKRMSQYIGGKPQLPYQKDDGNEAAGNGEQFMYRAMFDIIEMPWDWPVDVNYHEARAFLNWKQNQDGLKYRMPTEAEFHLYRSSIVHTSKTCGDNRLTEDDVMMHESIDFANVNLKFGSSTPVDLFMPSSTGVYDAHGNVWEYVEDHFASLPGFQFHPLYDDFSTPCFDGWHTMIMGGSWISTGDQASNFARYAFRRHFFQHLGFRYVVLDDDATNNEETYPGERGGAMNLWAGKSNLSSIMTDSFGSGDTLPASIHRSKELFDLNSACNYYEHLAKYVQAVCTRQLGESEKQLLKKSVLVLGCKAGGNVFQIARYFGYTMGIDDDETCIRYARIMQHHGLIEYERIMEGTLSESTTVKLPEDIDRTQTAFVHCADMTTLAQQESILSFSPFDIVVIDDILTEATNPSQILSAAAKLCRGILIISCNNKWDTTFTPRSKWIGGFCMNGQAVTTMDMLQYELKPLGFTSCESKDLPQLRETSNRTFNLNIQQVSIWCQSSTCRTFGSSSGGTSTLSSISSEELNENSL